MIEIFLLMKVLDVIDCCILMMLQDNGKAINKEIVSVLGMSIIFIYEWIKKMEDVGYIKKYIIVVDKDMLGYYFMVFCNVWFKEYIKEYFECFEEQVVELLEVLECYYVVGNFDYLFKVIVVDMEVYYFFIMIKLVIFDNIGYV